MGAATWACRKRSKGSSPRLMDLVFAGRAGRFELRRGPFRQGGRPHELLVISDLTRPLREEERRAWQKLVRVAGARDQQLAVADPVALGEPVDDPRAVRATTGSTMPGRASASSRPAPRARELHGGLHAPREAPEPMLRRVSRAAW